MKKIPAKYILILLFLASFFALAGAYISQYFFDLQPCSLCYYQRYPFFAIIILAILFLTIPFLKKYQKLGVNIAVIFLLINAAIAFYHSGVERKFFKELSSCSSELETPGSVEELEQMLAATKVVRCDEPQFFFMYLSMAEWNFLYCLGLALLTLFFLKKKDD